MSALPDVHSPNQDDGSAVVALARQVGLYGVAQKVDQFEATPETLTRSFRPQHQIDPTVALAQKVGLTGFASQGEAPQLRPDRGVDPSVALARKVGLFGFAPRSQVRSHRPDHEVDPTVALARRIGMYGFPRVASVAPAQPCNDASKREPAPPSPASSIVRSASEAPVPAKAPALPTAARPKPLPSGSPYAVLLVAPGGGSALAALERRMGACFTAMQGGQPCWTEKVTPLGTARAFSLTATQHDALKPIAGCLGTDGLRLSIGAVDLRGYKLTGPGAGVDEGKCVVRQLPPSVTDKLVSLMRSST